MTNRMKNLRGAVIATATLIEPAGYVNPASKRAGMNWRCRCACGAEFVSSLNDLGKARRRCERRTCGCAVGGRTHGESRTTKEYRVWKHMRQRCQNPKNKCAHLYSERGITVCPEWDDYPTFLAHVGRAPSPKHSLDRIDNDGGYEPGNVRWATPREQMNNKRNNVHILSPAGEVLSPQEVSARTGRPLSTVYGRRARMVLENRAIDWDELTRLTRIDPN